MLFRIKLTALLVVSVVPMTVHAQPALPLPVVPRPELTHESATHFLRLLQSDNYFEREQASNALEHIGTDSISDLTAACSSADAETAFRAVSILEHLYVDSLMLEDDELTDQIENSLESLSQSTQPLIADKIQYIYDQNSLIAEQALIRKVRRLGGIVVFTDTVTRRVPFENRMIQRVGVDVVIGPDWSGGEPGLKALHRLGALRRIYLVDGAPVSMAALEEIQSYQPNLEIQRRSPARLGVQGLNGIDECRLSAINANSAASKAGLDAGDVVVAFGADPIRNFDDLIKSIQKHQPGEVIPMRILRNNQELRLEVTLEGWHQD